MSGREKISAVQLLILNYSFLIILSSCSLQKKINHSAKKNVLTNDALATAHVGISIYEPATGKYWYNYDGDKYFVPASNTKIPTCYAAMKYLGDSLVGLRIGVPEEKGASSNMVIIDPTSDPTFLLKEFNSQPVFDYLKKSLASKKYLGILLKKNNFERWGSGWSWNDYESDYMAERSALPIFGNVINVELLDTSKRTIPVADYPWLPKYRLFSSGVHLFDSLLNNLRPPIGKSLARSLKPELRIHRDISGNSFEIEKTSSIFTTQTIPFVTHGESTAIDILVDTFKVKLAIVGKEKDDIYFWDTEDSDIAPPIHIKKWITIHSQPTDSVLKPMMHRSDNFFAEQMLLMVSNEQLGYMNDAAIIDTLLKTDFKELPQKPRWVDGSGLSRYNLFTPQDLVAILTKMKNEFGMDRIKTIFATGGEGTLSNYYVSDKDFIYAKTGTLSGVVAISGFITTKKNKQLIFSVLVNNHNTSATAVRRAVEKFIHKLRSDY